MMWIISILWCFIGLQQFMSLEDADWSQATAADKALLGILFIIFGPCIMISNVILGMVDLICGGNDDHYFRM